MTKREGAEMKPNLFIVGAMKAGTTTLFEQLSECSEIFVPEIKEPNFFCEDLHGLPQFHRTRTIHNFYGLKWFRSLRDYERLYKPAPAGSRYLLDASTTYLYSSDAASNIKRFNPAAKIIILLRSPFDRALSEFTMNRAIGAETSPFETCLMIDCERVRSGNTDLFERYVRAGLYSAQIARYLAEFDRSQVYIDVIDRPGETFSDVTRRLSKFLGIDVPESTLQLNYSRTPAFPLVNSLLYYSGAKAMVSRTLPRNFIGGASAFYYERGRAIREDRAVRVPPEVEALFADDIGKTEIVTGLNLRHWLDARKGVLAQSPTKVAWLSHGYGYNGNLMYFEGIFARFTKIYPNTVIYVDGLTYEKNTAKLSALRPLSFLTLKISRKVASTSYDTDFKVPSPRIIWQLFANTPDLGIVIEFTPIAMLSAFLLKTVFGRRVLMLVENSPHYRGAPMNRFFLRVKRYFANNVDCVMTNNADGKAFVASELGVPERRILVAPYLTSDPPVGPESEFGIGDLSVRENELTFLFLNSITPRKGLLELLNALLLLERGDLAKIRLVVAGDGEELPAAQAFAEQNGLGQTVRFLGRVPYEAISQLFRAADVFVSPQLADYRSLTGFEALKFAKPILISKYDGAHLEVVRDGENGFIIDPRDPASVADKIRWFVENPGRIAGMRAKSAAIAKHYTVDAIVENLQNAVDTVLRPPT